MAPFSGPAQSVETLLNAALRHSRFVIASKGVLWGLAIALVFAAVWIPLQGGGRDAFRLVSASVHPGDTDDARMVNPRFDGLDADNRPYRVTADVAIPQADSTVRLENLDADVTLQDGAWLTAAAKEGVLDVEGKRLALRGGIELMHDAGYALTTDTAALDLASGVASGQSAVSMHGPAGAVTASGFTIERKGERLRFDGPVHMTLYPSEGKAP